jgi:hypothetical protein
MRELDLSAVLQRSELTEREALFVAAILKGMTPEAAAAQAGYKATGGYVYEVLDRPSVAAAIENALRRRLVSHGAVVAIDRLITTALTGSGTGPSIDASKFLAGLSGYVAPKAVDARPLGDVLADVSLDELRAIIDKREASAAQRAKPVDATVLALEDDKLLNLLD